MDDLQRLALAEALGEIPHPRSVLDIGCGTGGFLRAAARALPDAALTGVDVSADAIRVAGDKAGAGEAVRFVQGRAEALPMPDSSADLVLTTRSFHHWADQSLGLAEVARVLRPGGVFVLADPLATGALGIGWVNSLAERLDGGRNIGPDALDAMLAASGLEIVRRVPAPHTAGTLHVTVARRA